ncbi:DUF6328 family protein [Arthrobacter sp. H35-D1]|uniref:DUF6328 family protein n=1 Tax=Arthrobacter sp. H35-D1 TaxID=3046202 RepID=UPI0024BBDA21|nr:DUF6328 family protein [Arthrobacter sp. H35-D1]MDJ0314901.1 DUF6328 family protein [Arthrobacter sp. H35-D1]
MESHNAEATSTGRNETPNEQQDRNWNDILQELRVMQTGVQIIAGFLLTLPFQQRFDDLKPAAVALYLILVVLAATATCLMLVPVALHRQMFRLQRKSTVVSTGHLVLKTVLVLVGLLITGTTTLIYYVVVGGTAGAIVAGVFSAVLVGGLFIYPRIVKYNQVK